MATTFSAPAETTEPVRRLPLRAAIAPLGASLFTSFVVAQTPPPQPSFEELLERVEAQDRRIRALESAPAQNGQGAGTSLVAGYDRGFFVRDAKSPFELRINGRMQFRFTGFDADSGGRTTAEPIHRNDFEIERGRLEFRGTFLDADTHFFINLDSDTDDNHTVIFHDFWINHRFCDGFDLYVGKAFVPGSRDWLAGSTSTHLVDRALATTFFRPDRSVGVWAIGEPLEDFHYRVMVGNGLVTTDLDGGEIDDNLAGAASIWWDPLADYGSGYADLEWHEDLAVRVGASVMYADEDDGQLPSNSEADAIRLSDGQRLTSSALMGESFDVQMLAIDAAFKYQGVSANAEAFFREIDQIVAMPGSPLRRSYYDWGGYCDVGVMLVAKTLEVVGRVSTVQGALDDSWEYAGGCNWYINGTHLNKLTLDATKLDGSPTNNSGPNYRLNDDGWLIRLQWQIAF